MLVLALTGCEGSASGGSLPERDAAAIDAPSTLDARTLDAGSELDGAATSADGSTSDASSPDDGALSPPAPPPPPPVSPPPIDCHLRSTTFGGAMLELDVGPTSSERLRFEVRDVPDRAVVSAATLEYRIFDADHPGMEGFIDVNGTRFDLPADAAGDNVETTGRVEVLGALAAGTNSIAFGPGPLDRSFFRVGDLALRVTAAVAACPGGAPAGPPPTRRVMDYLEATYEMRRNWVNRCRFAEGYMYTARGSDHLTEDCDGLYDPDGSRAGRAVFVFESVSPYLYDVVVRSRHATNRNPAGAIVIVNGEEARVDQTDGDAFEDDVWGRRMLEGTVTVVIDSREGQSESVSEIRLEPVTP